MEFTPAPDADSATPPARHSVPGRYRWATRLFITVSATSIVLRSAFNIGMHHMPWLEELEMYTVPLALPSRAERREIAEGHSSKYVSLGARLLATGASLVRFVQPLPAPRTASHLDNLTSWLHYVAVWGHTRLEFLGRLIGVEERWTMYSPSVGTSRGVVRGILHFRDGSRLEIRSLAEPADLTTFIRPFAQRRLQHDINISNLDEVRLGWARSLAKNNPHNEHGSPLTQIDLHMVQHDLAPPHVDRQEFWARENLRPVAELPFWRYDPVTDEGTQGSDHKTGDVRGSVFD